jgi:hypothetical protein
MTPLRDLGRRASGREVKGPAFFTRTRAEIEASKLDREMNGKDRNDTVVLFEFRTVRVQG